MNGIPAADLLLDAWDRGRSASPAQRGLLLLAIAEPELPAEALALWSVGRRDAALLALRERAFGPQITGLAACPQCGEPLELEFAVADIVVAAAQDSPATLSVIKEGYSVSFRVPNAGDMAALAQANSAVAPERWLLERCIVDAREVDKPCAVADLPDTLLAAVAAAIAEADPQAEVELALICPACDRHWQALFDIVSFLWREIDAWAARMLREVHILASAYGWSERDILALSPWRRQYYLEQIAG